MIRKFQFNKKRYTINTDSLQGYDLVTGHILFFKRNLFTGSYRRPKYDGCEFYIVEIESESYGSNKGQHTFTLRILKAFDKNNERKKGDTIRIKGRNLYPNCKILEEPDDVGPRQREKHERGFWAKQRMEAYRY